MKLIYAVTLGLFVNAAQAADDTLSMTYGKQLASAMTSSVCAAVTQPTAKMAPNGSSEKIYDASTEDLHRCLYITEMSDSGCAPSGSCPSYEDWTRANPDISPTLARDAFLSALSARKSAAHSQDN